MLNENFIFVSGLGIGFVIGSLFFFAIIKLLEGIYQKNEMNMIKNLTKYLDKKIKKGDVSVRIKK